ncbi:HEPN domain-containing protein [Bacillus amyloliquefaciens]
MFEYEDIKSEFENILNRWFEKEEDLKAIISLHLNKFESYYIESKFLTSIQALEIFHRRFYGGNILDQQIYNQASDKIKEFISEELEGEVRDFFLAKFKHGNEYNLGKRLRELINKLSQDSKLYIIGKSERRTSFLQKLIETRNYLTHYDDSGKTTILKHPYVKYFAVIRMNIILVFVLLKELGIDEELILKKFKDHRNTNFLIEEAKKVFG